MRFYNAAVFVFLLGVSCGTARAQNSGKLTDVPEAPSQEKWFDTSHMDEHVIAQKQRITLSIATALQIFQDRHPRVVADWREKLKREIEAAPDAASLNATVEEEMVKSEGVPFAGVRKFSKSHLRVMILKPVGYYLWHRYYECLADFAVPRSTAIDKIFELQALERAYCATIKGIGHGDSEKAMKTALGKPDATRTHQAVGLVEHVYLDANVVIHLENSQVKTIDPRVPAQWKKELQETGKLAVPF